MPTWSKIAAVLALTLGLSVPLAGSGTSLAQTVDPQQPATTAPSPSIPPQAVPPTVATSGAAVPATPASNGLPPEVLEPVERLARNIESAEKSIQQLKELEGELVRLRNEVERIIYDSTSAAETLRPQLDEVTKQIERIGPPPAKDQPAESPTVAAERARLNTLKASLDGAIKTTELAWVRAKQLIDRITLIRYQLFTRNLLERRDSPVLPGVWRNVADQMPTVLSRLSYYTGDWMVWALRVATPLMALLAFVVGGYFILTVVIRRFIRRCLVRPEGSPTFFERTLKAAWVAPARMVPAISATLLLYFGLAGLDLLFSPWLGLASATLGGLLVYAASTGLLWVNFVPSHPAWRLVPVGDHTARRILAILEAFVAVYVIDIILVELGRTLYVPLAITVAQSFVTSLFFSLLLALLILTPFVPQTGPDRPVNGHVFVPGPVSLMTPFWIKLPLLATLIVILGSSLLGYIALGRFVAHQVVLSGTVLAGCGLLYLAVRSATRGRADNRDLIGQTLETRFGLVDPGRRRQISRLLEVLATLTIALVAAPLLMLQWGLSGADIRDWGKALLFGFEVGQFRISLARILIGIGLFTTLLFLTRVLQRWLRDQVLAQSRVEAGIANSVETAVGYAGVGLALLIALSYAGLDITSLAIVAGALSVGIGFGLQSIVNNFVSGLILLVERPVKVGDWIVVGNEQGNVRRISVRSTEIETFDRASLIIPNSELITGRVLNWTHRNPMGRAVVKVEVAPNADPEQILAILRQCAADHPDTLKTPPAFITFDRFSSTVLEFTVRAVVADVYTGNRVASELRVAILKELRQQVISMPPPQIDVTMRDLDWIKAAAARIGEQRSGGSHRPEPRASAADVGGVSEPNAADDPLSSSRPSAASDPTGTAEQPKGSNDNT